MRDPELQDKEVNLLDDVCCSLSVCPCLTPLHREFPSVKLAFQFEKTLCVHIDWTAVEQINFMKNTLLVQLTNKPFLAVATTLAKLEKTDVAHNRREAVHFRPNMDVPDEDAGIEAPNALVKSESSNGRLKVTKIEK